MKTRIEPELISIDGTMRIGIKFPYNPQIIGLARRIPGARYSGEQRCWHIAPRPDVVLFLREWFGETCEVAGQPVTGPDRKPASTEPDSPTRSARDAAEQASAGAKQARHDTAVQANAETKQAQHGTADQTSADVNSAVPSHGAPTNYDPARMMRSTDYNPFFTRRKRVEMANIPGSRMMMIKFQGYYEKRWIAEMRQYGKVDYLRSRNEWRLPWSKQAVDSLSDYFSNEGLEVDVRRNVVPPAIVKQRDEVAGAIRQRELGLEAHEAVRLLERRLREKRQSDSTVRTYTSMLMLFLKYFNDRRPDEITTSDVSDFMTEFIIPLDYSASFQNQLVTAIKTYYSLTGGKVSTASLLRPKRSRPLPKVFSKEEVKRILNATVNIKHRLILWMIYSCGLRRGEITNIKLTDLDRSRNLLHIRQGKGKVDRVVPMSAKVWDKVDEYIEGFRPRVYLFEGQSGGRYTTGSVYNVFKGALRRSGIRKEVGVHSLRHSYATHLHESGLDIRYIQELLGHRSSRTTEIYTHVSRRSLMSVRNPIDDIDLR